jgi:hypothetical protein
MERRKRLVAKKGLQIYTPLKSRKGLIAKKMLQPRSAKMKKIYEKRSVFVKEFLNLYPKCQAHWDNNCYINSTDVHEILPRGVGGKIVDTDWSNYMSLCRYCHTMITDNPEEAHKRGYRKWSWE